MVSQTKGVRMAFGKVCSFSLFGSLAFTSVPAYSQVPEIDAPAIGSWVLERAPDRCHLSRQFGNAANPYQVVLTQIDPWDGGYQVDLSGPELGNHAGPFTVEWSPDGRASTTESLHRHRDENGREWARFDYGPRTNAAEALDASRIAAFAEEGGFERFRANVRTLRVSGFFGGTVVLQTGEIASVSEQLDACIAEVFQAQGIVGSEIERDDHSVEPTNPFDIMPILTRRLPLEIRSRPRPTMVSFLLYLDEAAQPTSCRLSTLPYDRDYERRTCRSLLSNAQFRFKAGEEARPTWFKYWFIQQPS